MAKHPELRQLLTDFVTAVVSDKPEDVVSYAKTFFSTYNGPKKDKVTPWPQGLSFFERNAKCRFSLLFSLF